MTQEDVLWGTILVIVTYILAIFTSRIFLKEEEVKEKGVTIPEPPKEIKKVKTFTNLPTEKAGPIRRPSADDLELKHRTREEKEQAEEFAKKMDQYVPKK